MLTQRLPALVVPLLILVSGVSSASEVTDSGMPVAPASVMTDNVPQPIQSGSDSARVDKVDTSASRFEVKPGETQVLAVSSGYMNRLVTPFPKAQVMTSSLQPGQNGQCGEICVKDNIVFVTPSGDKPVALNVYQEGQEDASMMLTLLPKKVPPREISLTLKGYTGMTSQGDTGAAEKWEESRPYTSTIRSLFRDLALGKVPQGYSMHSMDKGPVPVCEQQGMDFDFTNGQLLIGSHFRIVVGVMQNTTDSPLEFSETSCGGWNVAAVAAWPRTMLGPGQETEVYVAFSQSRISHNRRSASERPSLVE